MRPISSHLDQKRLVNKEFIVLLSGKFFLRDMAGSPERARQLHLAHSGSQSQCTIWVILPAHRASHNTKCIIVCLRMQSLQMLIVMFQLLNASLQAMRLTRYTTPFFYSVSPVSTAVLNTFGTIKLFVYFLLYHDQTRPQVAEGQGGAVAPLKYFGKKKFL